MLIGFATIEANKPAAANVGAGAGGGGGETTVMCGRSLSKHRASHPYSAGTEGPFFCSINLYMHILFDFVLLSFGRLSRTLNGCYR